MAEGGEAVASEAAPTAEADALIVDAGTKPMADQNAPVDQSGSGAAAPDAAGDGSYDAEGPVGAAAAAEAEEIRGEQNGVAAMAVDGLAAVQEAAPAGAFAAADQPGACETPLPEEEQAQVVAALSASATAGQQDALAAMSPHAPAVPASDGQAHEAGSTDEAEPQAGKPSAPPVAAAPPARVPARALYGLSVDEGENGQPAQQAQHVGGQSQRAQLPLLPRMEDDGRLPAYAVAGGEDSWQHDPGLRGARKGAHADEDPPPGFQPVDIFIGGLPPTADDFDVWQAVVPAGEVVGVKLIRRKRDRGDCRGYGFVRMANREAAEAACQTVKEACGVPVAMSLSSSKTLPELHAAAAAAAATTPLQLPKDSDSSLVQLMEAVRQQKDRQAAVTTALVAVLHPAAEKPAAAVGGKQQRGAEGGPGTSSPAVGEEGLPDGTNYMDPYPAVKALMAEFKARGQDNKTPLAMLNEYASRLALRVDTEEQPPPEGATGPISVAIKLVNSRGGQSFATSTGRGRTKQIGRQIASAALLETILETVPAEDLLAPNRNKPGGGKQPWQAPQRHGVGHDVGGRGRGRGGAARVSSEGRPRPGPAIMGGLHMMAQSAY
ncbi:hypothetical protein CHLNCDRAFT_58974 [Chlorella variabilis]|uniref:RRM domain-containing protein n=1 Tax=Chlorella variabilis TaxID=554065 RepID=E1ZPV5_CHLVA|nr:hypothetical protein CHLNCDRAFT_58974 [Chlorella variabilis]EFN52131.1 hypothetical protein CHLNCDRAFT_58974 [Chlorella variabilis]|eukprot:XP_005844233.1 hypothetical protein CHLNCDRAFT_58974 [Chlorella variabilis]